MADNPSLSGTLGEAAARQLSTVTTGAPTWQGITPRWVVPLLEWVPVDDLLAGVREGRVTDGPTAQAVLGYMLFHRREEAGR